MNKNSFTINIICLFTQFMWFYVMGLTTPFQVRTNNYYGGRYEDHTLIR